MMTPPPYYPPPSQIPTKSKAPSIALVLGVGALLTFWTVLGGIIFGVAAIIVGLKGRSLAKATGVPTGTATSGAVTGAIAAVFAVAFAVFAASLPAPKTEAKTAPAATATTAPPTSAVPPTTPAVSSLTPAPAPSPVPTAGDGTHGITSMPAYWDDNFTKATKVDCLDQGEDNLGSGVGWWIAPGVLFCAQDPTLFTTWQGHIISGHLHFLTPSDATTATKAARQLLPDDTDELRQVQGHNPDWSKVSTGTCKSIEYHSDTLAKTVSSINPTWKDADKAEFTLYSGKSSSDVGSDSAYDGSHIKEMLIGIGSMTPNRDGNYPC